MLLLSNPGSVSRLDPGRGGAFAPVSEAGSASRKGRARGVLQHRHPFAPRLS